MIPKLLLWFVLCAVIILIVNIVYLSQMSPIHHKWVEPAISSGSSCNIPKFSPWDPAIVPFIHVPKEIFTCKEKPPLLQRLNETHLSIDEAAALKHYGVTNVSDDGFFCVGQEIVRVQDKKRFRTHNYYYFRRPDNNYTLKKLKIRFNTTQEIPFEFTLATCFNNYTEIIYKNIYISFHLKVKKVTQRLSPNSIDRISILIVAIDSVSKYHFLRAFPLTSKLIAEKGFIHLDKFVKIGENTLPNIITTLSGEYLEQQLCWQDDEYASILDDCNFIWKNFSAAGYLTAHFEDRIDATTFNHGRPGFFNQPVDYYYRPGFLAMGDHLNIRKNIKGIDKLNCYGDRFGPEIIVDATKNFASRLKAFPYFGIFWASEFTHDNLSLGFQADHFYKELFEHLFSSDEILNQTIVFFISDHGHSFGDAQELYMSWLEHRMPFYSIWIPEWFKKQYPKAMKNLMVNTNRLASPFDTYKTMMDVVKNDFSGNVSGNFGKLGISLFRPIPENRTCREAGVPPEYCTCLGSCETTVKSEVVRNSVKTAMEYISKTLNTTELSGKCRKVELNLILSARVFETDKTQSNVTDRLVTFQTNPGLSVFRATVRQTFGTEYFEVLGHVERLNSFGNQSYCVKEPVPRLYCFCI